MLFHIRHVLFIILGAIVIVGLLMVSAKALLMLYRLSHIATTFGAVLTVAIGITAFEFGWVFGFFREF